MEASAAFARVHLLSTLVCIIQQKAYKSSIFRRSHSGLFVQHLSHDSLTLKAATNAQRLRSHEIILSVAVMPPVSCKGTRHDAGKAMAEWYMQGTQSTVGRLWNITDLLAGRKWGLNKAAARPA